MALQESCGGVRFALENWAASADGLSTHDDWLAWFRQPRPVGRLHSADLSWVPASLRRRVSPLGRAALNVLSACQPEQACPIVFASRHGDLEGTAELLAQLHAEGGVSPMGFSLAVHNAAIGIYSIARQDRTTTTSIAANVDLAEAACTEAMGWLASGATQVLLVCCDDPAPPPYRAEEGAVEFRYAWAGRLRLADRQGISLQLREAGEESGSTPPRIPSSLAALAFLTGSQSRTQLSGSGKYVWSRND